MSKKKKKKRNLFQHGNAVTLTDHLPCQKLFLVSFPLVIFNPYLPLGV